MQCKICGSEKIKIIYNGLIRDGGLGNYTKNPVPMYQCNECSVIWHEKTLDTKTYYESQEYRKQLEGSSEEQDFYRLHDKESLDKFLYIVNSNIQKQQERFFFINKTPNAKRRLLAAFFVSKLFSFYLRSALLQPLRIRAGRRGLHLLRLM